MALIQPNKHNLNFILGIAFLQTPKGMSLVAYVQKTPFVFFFLAE